MRLKPVRGSIRGKTSDGNTTIASNNEISPEVEQRAGEHIYVCVFVCECVCVERDGGARVNEGGWAERKHTYSSSRNKKGVNNQGQFQFIAIMVLLL